jgi:hypothetical protein
VTDLGELVRSHLQSVFEHSRVAKQVSQDFIQKVPLKLGIMSTISPDEIIDLIANPGDIARNIGGERTARVHRAALLAQMGKGERERRSHEEPLRDPQDREGRQIRCNREQGTAPNPG